MAAIQEIENELRRLDEIVVSPEKFFQYTLDVWKSGKLDTLSEKYKKDAQKYSDGEELKLNYASEPAMVYFLDHYVPLREEYFLAAKYVLQTNYRIFLWVQKRSWVVIPLHAILTYGGRIGWSWGHVKIQFTDGRKEIFKVVSGPGNDKVNFALSWRDWEKLSEFERSLLTMRKESVQTAINKRKNELKKTLAKLYEAKLEYERAAELYEELGMYEDARRCREKMASSAVSTPSHYAPAQMAVVSVTPAVEQKIKRERIKEMYRLNEKKDISQLYNWGEFTVYGIVRKIGSGGFSDVYLVERSGKRYAMKIPKGVDLKGDETIVLSDKDLEQYGKEAEIWAMLTERVPDAVINLIDAGIHPFPWFVMELGDKSLKDVVSEMRYEEKLKVAMDLLGKLDQIHHFGVVHKDIKPENILYAGGEWKFTDFGLSKIVNKSSKSSQMLSGTLLYMAPEQISKKKFGHTDWRTDIWQMGVMIYELLTGHTPFEAEDAGELAMSVIMEEPVPATKYGVSEEVWRVIEKALRKEKEERWQSAIEMKNALQVAIQR